MCSLWINYENTLSFYYIPFQFTFQFQFINYNVILKQNDELIIFIKCISVFFQPAQVLRVTKDIHRRAGCRRRTRPVLVTDLLGYLSLTELNDRMLMLPLTIGLQVWIVLYRNLEHNVKKILLYLIWGKNSKVVDRRDRSILLSLSWPNFMLKNRHRVQKFIKDRDKLLRLRKKNRYLQKRMICFPFPNKNIENVRSNFSNTKRQKRVPDINILLLSRALL